MNQFVIRSNEGSKFIGTEGREATYGTMEEAAEVMRQIQAIFHEEYFAIHELEQPYKKISPVH